MTRQCSNCFNCKETDDIGDYIWLCRNDNEEIFDPCNEICENHVFDVDNSEPLNFEYDGVFDDSMTNPEANA